MTRLHLTNPYTGERFAEFDLESIEQINHKLGKARQSHEKWRQLSVDNRITLIHDALTYFEQNKAEIAQDITVATGKPIQQSYNEIKGFFERANTLCKLASETLADELLPEKIGFYRAIRHEPLGVIFVISAWNYPLLITVNSVIAGLLAGNTILLKHSSITTKLGEHFAKALGQISEYSDLVQNIIVDHETTNRIIREAKIDHVVFTGSVQAGHDIYQQVAHQFIGCNLELGGKDGAYVADDADLSHAASMIVDGAFYNAGQSCCGIERVYVHEAVYDDFVQRCVDLTKDYQLGDPMLEQTNMGPLAKAASAEPMMQQINQARETGAQIRCGGQCIQIEAGTFMQPTILTGVKQSSLVIQKENFGPILPILKVTDDQAGFCAIADSEYGLTAAIFTQSQRRAESFAKHINAGTIFMNRCDYLDPELPWTGVKDSGLGSALSKYGFYELTRRKALHFKLL